MGRLTRAIGALLGKDTAGASATTLDDLFRLFSFSFTSKAGQEVTVDRALQVASVFALTRVLSEGMAQTPVSIKRQDSDGSKVTLLDHPVHRLLSHEPNDWQTPFEFRETQMIHAVLTGGGYAYKSMDSTGTVRELLPLLPTHCTARQDRASRIWYDINFPQSNEQITVPRDEIVHLRGPSWNSVVGLQPVRLAANAIGLSMAIEEAQSKLQANGLQPGGIISMQGTLSKEARQKIRDKITETHGGAIKAGNVMILDQAAKFERMIMTGVDAQTLESRKFQVEELCRLFRVFPQMIGFSEKNTAYASSEQFFLAHVIHSLVPWGMRFEQVTWRDLLHDYTLSAMLDYTAFLRGDAKARAEYYASGIVNGWLVRNEARVAEGYEKLDGLDEPLTPLNLGQGKQGADAQIGRGASNDNAVAQMRALLLEVGVDRVKIGRVLSAMNERRIVEAKALLDEVLATLGDATESAATRLPPPAPPPDPHRKLIAFPPPSSLRVKRATIKRLPDGTASFEVTEAIEQQQEAAE